MDKLSELKAVESQWKQLDDSSIIRDVLFKGKYVSHALKFISERNKVSEKEAKLIFFEVTRNIVKILVQNKQLHRANHVLKNAQFNETHYLYDLSQENSDKTIKEAIMDFLKRSNPDFQDNEKVLKANHTCFNLLMKNIARHLKYLDILNRNYDNFIITPHNIQNSNIIFGTFMKQPIKWRNEIAIDVFFKSKRDPENLLLLPMLDKESFFNYIIQNELYGLLKKWLNEQYLSQCGTAIKSKLNDPDSLNFDEALNYLFRTWKFEPVMMEKISRREKDVIKNDFAKLGLFESREAKCVCRKLNRLFTTHTFNENHQLAVKSEEITKFIVENRLIDLLCESFIDHNFIRNVLESNSCELMSNELMLLLALKNLLSKETSMEDFVSIMKVTSEYILKYDKSFDDNRTDLMLFQELSLDSFDNFRQIAESNAFLRNLYHKLSTNEELPTIEYLLENFHAIKLDFIRDELSSENLSFDDAQLAKSYGDNFSLSYTHYIKQNQGVFASFLFVMEMIKNSMTISRPQIMSGCEEVAKLAMQDPQNEKLVAHSIAFIECFNVDSKNLRCILQLLKLKKDDVKGFEKFLNTTICASTSEEDIKKVEALETFWSVKKYETPSRAYLDTFIENEDWFRFILLAQYFNYPLENVVTICEERIKNKTLWDNLIRAVSFDIPDLKHVSFTKRRRSQSTSESEDLFKDAKFLSSKHDLFAILLKCNESISRVELPFEEFQKFFLRDQSDEVGDLLFQARKYEWPLIAILAATTTLYRIKYCWLTWLILSSDFKYTKKLESIEELARNVFEHCLNRGFIRTLHESALIFYPDSTLEIFTKFLLHTKNGDFANMESLLKVFIVRLSEHDYKMIVLKGKEKLLPFIFRCLILHLQFNIRFGLQKEQYLECLHRSEVSQFVRKIDFGFLKKLSKILEQTCTRVNYEIFLEGDKRSMKEIEKILGELIHADHFKEAIEITELMKMPKSDFVFKLWRRMYEKEDQKQTSFDIEKYLTYVEAFELNIEIFIKFLSSIVDNMIDSIEKYKILKFILKNSKTGSDSLEYDVIYLYVRLKCENIENLEPLTSKYYQDIISKEKNLIHESLYELKSIAKIDDLSISFKSLTNKAEKEELENLIFYLLDLNDIVQVLRIQEMFGCAPEDLKILVYMLSVCEGLTSIYDITKQERQTISSFGQMSNIFNKFTLRSLRTSNANSMSSSMISTDLNESFPSESTKFHENKETFAALQGLASKIKHGVKYGQRIVLIYRASLFLNRSFKFSELMKMRSAHEFLELATSCESENILLVMSDIIQAMGMTEIEVAEFVSKEIVACTIRTRFLQFSKETEMATSTTSSSSPSHHVLDEIWGFSLSKDLHLIFELCKGKTTLLGNYLIKYYKIMSQSVADIPIHSSEKDLEKLCEHLNRTLSPQIMSQKKQNIIRVEILIIAHDNFLQECSTEGIANILNLAKSLINTLASKKSFNLIVRLLCGIGRFREMFYAFDLLIKNEVFESLLGQFNDKQANGLKNAILSYLNENHPNNKDYYKITAAHFSMYTELANHSKSSSMEKLQKVMGESQVKRMKSGRINTNQVQQVEIPYLRCNKNILITIQDALNDIMHATEMLSIDNKIEMSVKFASFCELIAMQIHLVKVGEENEEKLCPCVINLEQHLEKFQYFANYELSVPQITILNKNVEGSIDYSKAIFVRSIVNGDAAYLFDYIERFEITDAMIENLVKLAQMESIEKKQEKILHDLVMMVRNSDIKFKLASLLGLKGILQNMLNDEQSYYYLLDTKYGNVEIF